MDFSRKSCSCGLPMAKLFFFFFNQYLLPEPYGILHFCLLTNDNPIYCLYGKYFRDYQPKFSDIFTTGLQKIFNWRYVFDLFKRSSVFFGICKTILNHWEMKLHFVYCKQLLSCIFVGSSKYDFRMPSKGICAVCLFSRH